MNNIAHPSSILNRDWIDTIRNEAALAEKQGSLTAAQLELIYKLGWFKLFVPEENSGTKTSLPDALHLEEALSWADGSFGWTVTLCAGAGWFGGFFDFDLAKEVFNAREVCLGGSGAPSGTAVRTENGYIITGRWKYATGAEHLTHFTANCTIKESEETENAEPLVLPFIFERAEVTIVNDWNTIGLVATSSQSFEVKNLFVPYSRCFQIAADARKVSQPIYEYPFLQFAEVTLAANISGMAVHFLDCCKDIFAKRFEGKKLKEPQQKLLTERLLNAENNLAGARSDFYQVVEKSWQAVVEGDFITEQYLQEISLKSRNLASASHRLVDTLYPLCGLVAANPASEINRVWRDIHTASQHSLLTLP